MPTTEQATGLLSSWSSTFQHWDIVLISSVVSCIVALLFWYVRTGLAFYRSFHSFAAPTFDYSPALVDASTEGAELATLLRQLHLLEGLTEDLTMQTGIPKRRGYHFDYSQLNADVARVRAGIEDCLIQLRSQLPDPQRYRASTHGIRTRGNADQ